MSGINSLDRRTQLLQHQKDLNNLKTQHQLELETTKLNHQKLKNQIKTSNKIEELDLHSKQKIDLAKQINKNEKTLEKLRESISQVEARTKVEKEKIISEHEKEKTNTDTRYENLIRSKKTKNEHLLQDMDHQAKIQIGRMQRQINSKKSETQQKGQSELNQIKVVNTGKIETDKDIYAKKQLAQTTKFQNALLNQKDTHNKTLVKTERDHQTKVLKREKNYKQEFENKTIDHKNKMTNLSKNHEKHFGEIYTKNEKSLQRLIGKKNKIIESLRQFVKKEAVKEMKMNNDNFYHYTGLEPKIQINQERTGYDITVPAPEHEAKKIKLVGFDRELKLTMDRDFDYKKTSDNGSVTVLKKNETLTSKIPVDYLVDPKSITKDYKDGNIVFKIKFA